MKKIPILISLILIINIGISQNITVLNKVNYKPVKDITVFNKSMKSWFFTDYKGAIEMEGVELYDTLVFQHPSYITEAITVEDLYLTDFKVYLTQKVVVFDEIVITAGKKENKLSNIPNQIDVIKSDDIRFRNPQTGADILQQSGNVYVQKSQLGGGSPVLRGFEANSVLLVLDGVRMNNAIYRSGHIQSAITVDPFSVNKAEILFGPGSVLYGSDAIGGVIHYLTPEVNITLKEEVQDLEVLPSVRFSSANLEKTANLTTNLGFKKFGIYTSITVSEFEDLRMGTRRSHGYMDWGRSHYYVKRILDKDTVLTNQNPNKQKYSGYNQFNLMQKFKYHINDDLAISTNIFYTNSSNIPRYDELNTFTTNNEGIVSPRRNAEWYYGPQQWLNTGINVVSRHKNAYDLMTFTTNYQKVQESRINRRYNRDTRNHQIEDVNMLSLLVDAQKKLSSKLGLQYGLEAIYNFVSSKAYLTDVNSYKRLEDIIPTRYPDGGSFTQQYAAYATTDWKPMNKISIHGGIRLNFVSLQSKFGEATFIDFPFDKYKLQKFAASGSLGVAYLPGKGIEIKANVSNGFRTPNVDDYGKIREANGEVTVPNLNLKPEYAYSAEFTFAKNFEDVARLTFTYYYTLLTNALVRQEASLYGFPDTLVYDGLNVKTVTLGNVNKASVTGFNIGFYNDIGKYFSLISTINFTRGKEITTGKNLAHIPPIFGKVSLQYHIKRFQSELFVHFNGQKSLSRYSESSEDRLEQATAQGTPSWYTINLSSSVQVHPNLSLQFAIENILDEHYKTFSSGISAPGRNFVVALRGNL
jgi:hemoglobin/transferrin/lactoferrin receptor protein